MRGSRRRTVLTAVAAATVGVVVWSPASQGAAAPDDPLSWSVSLRGHGIGEVNVRHVAAGVIVADPHQRPAANSDTRGYAMDLLDPHAVGQPVGEVAAELDARVPTGAEVDVDVRGQRSDGTWTEWRTAAGGAPAILPSPSVAVQTRLTLRAAPDGASPTVSGVRLTASPTVWPDPQVASTPLTFSVFATREGLVGGTTANGHTITTRDHFVALPSGRALSPLGSTEFSVRVCNPANGRCETAPVWDVGPWNTKDDYWNPSSIRQMWNDLPQGLPEAQAAFQNGYNGGKDQFGRTVLNPAGIDLADGTFIDGLGMTNNGFVNVTYLWTSSQTWPTVRSGDTGERVKTVQYLLNATGAGLSVDGVFGPATTAAVTAFQQAHGITADGIVGSQTWPLLAVTVQEGSTGDAVRAVQSQLTAHGIPTTVDGQFGPATTANVKTFQTSRGLSADGIVGPATWQALVA